MNKTNIDIHPKNAKMLLFLCLVITCLQLFT